jgi:hypothetical protein
MWIVVFDSDDNIFPMTADADCEGAICIACNKCEIALFDSPADARKAIAISKAFAQLQRLQGKPANTDFLKGVKHVKVRKLKRYGSNASSSRK